MTSARTHYLKTWPEPFRAVLAGKKTHEIRRCDDRSFAVRDDLLLQEYDPDTRKLTGRELLCAVSHITAPNLWGLPDNLCVMSIVPYLYRPGDGLTYSFAPMGAP